MSKVTLTKLVPYLETNFVDLLITPYSFHSPKSLNLITAAV
jgi:hypothetical protein